MEAKMNVEMKKMGVQQAILSLIVIWKELQDLLNSSENKPSAAGLHYEKYGNIVSVKFKEIDLNGGPTHDFSKIHEIDGNRLRKMMDTIETFCKEKSKEIEEKMEETEYSKKFIGELAREIELKEKKVDDKFKKFEAKIAEERSKIKAKMLEIEKRGLEVNKREEDMNSREKKVKDIEIIYWKKHEEIVGKMREINTRQSSMEEYANSLESRRKELDEGFQELNSKKTEFAGVKSKVAAKCAEFKEYHLKLKARAEELNARKKELKIYQIQCGKKSEETEDKIKEINSARESMEIYAKELESKKKELDSGFKELELKRMECTKMTDGSAGVNISSAETSMNPTKRRRREAPTRTELPAPEVSPSVLNQNSDSRETFWTCCISCHFKYRYTKDVLNNESTCRHCSTKFTAYELDAASLPQVDYAAEHISYYLRTDRNAGNNGAGGSGSV